MGILIKGMEMPKTCGKCMLKNAIECNRWKLVRSIVLDRHRDCPLVPVPTPHGRLIDADKLNSSETDYLGNHFVYLVDIDDAPTIISAEEDE